MSEFSSSKYNRVLLQLQKLLVVDKDIEDIKYLNQKTEDEAKNYLRKQSWWTKEPWNVWLSFLQWYQQHYSRGLVIHDYPFRMIDDGSKPKNNFQTSKEPYSAWRVFKDCVLSKKMSEDSVEQIEKVSKRILNRLSLDTQKSGPIKGLVTGSVQSGKTANMEALIAQAADHGWNVFIILTGMIENLRQQTYNRIKDDLHSTRGIHWHHCDLSSPENEDKNVSECFDLAENDEFKPDRYVICCLKQSSRLKNLIDWLHGFPSTTKKMKVLILDDEADQASVCTADIADIQLEDRKTINRLITNLVHGYDENNRKYDFNFKAVNYICYTATPYANVLNESGDQSLFPKNFVSTLSDPKEYFGLKVIFGNKERDLLGFPIVRKIENTDALRIQKLVNTTELPKTLKNAIAWYLCAVAIYRHSGRKSRNLSMLIHSSVKTDDHRFLRESVEAWLNSRKDVLEHCRSVFSKENGTVTIAQLKEANPDYDCNDICEFDFSFEDFVPELEKLLEKRTYIGINGDEFAYTDGLHLCEDNSSADFQIEKNVSLRINYPADKDICKMGFSPAFLVIGGNTLSRGLTIEGLVCTYFCRNTNQGDTLMQMGRWFGYRKGYELLQRVWLTNDIREKFEALALIDMDMKDEIADFEEKGLSPEMFGIRIRHIPSVARFRLTAKNKMQDAIPSDFDFTGASYAVTKFENTDRLGRNLEMTKLFVSTLVSKNFGFVKSEFKKGYVFRNVPFSLIKEEFLSKYEISDSASFKSNVNDLIQWMDDRNSQNQFIYWNIAFVNGPSQIDPPLFKELNLGLSNRSKILNLYDPNSEIIDIHSMQSGRDALIDVEAISDDQVEEIRKAIDKGTDLRAKRLLYGLSDVPLLLVYILNKNGGDKRFDKENKVRRVPLDSKEHIVTFSIIVPGDKKYSGKKGHITGFVINTKGKGN